MVRTLGDMDAVGVEAEASFQFRRGDKKDRPLAMLSQTTSKVVYNPSINLLSCATLMSRGSL